MPMIIPLFRLSACFLLCWLSVRIAEAQPETRIGAAAAGGAGRETSSTPGSSLELQISGDLQEWTPLAFAEAGDEPVRHEDAPPGNLRFYRWVDHAYPWVHLGPGGGGQIQGIHFDPSTPGRLFLASDVDGLYESRDFGQSWKSLHAGIVMYHTRDLKVHPADPQTLYAGHWWGLQISRDGGNSWQLPGSTAEPESVAFGLRNHNIGTLAVTPLAPDHIYAAPNWNNKNDALFDRHRILPQSPLGERWFHYSHDAGHTWARSRYEARDGYRPVYDIRPDPLDPAVVWLGAHSGLYRGAWDGSDYAWTRIAGPSPSDTVVDASAIEAGNCYGVDLSPDGRWVYACFTVDDKNEPNETRVLSLPFAARVADLLAAPAAGTAWIPLADTARRGQLPVPDDDTPYGTATSAAADTNVNYWRPRVDPRSTATAHAVLLGSMNSLSGGPHGAFEIRLALDGPEPAGSWVRIFAQNGAATPDGGVFAYDPGWNGLTSRCRHVAYSPPEWDAAWGRRLLLAPDQTLLVGTTGDGSHLDSWQPLTSRLHAVEGSARLYASRGVVATVDFDIARLGDYVLTVGADNASYESFDGGLSWRGSPNGLGHGDACLVVPTDPPIALHSRVANAFGGAASDAVAVLHGKRLVAGDSSDPWRIFAGGTSGQAGYRRSPADPASAGMRPIAMAHAPGLPARIAMTTQYGVLLCENLPALAEDVGDGLPVADTHFSFLESGSPAADYKGLHFDGDEAIFFQRGSSIRQAVRQPSGSWTVRPYADFGPDPLAWHFWRDNGQAFHVLAQGETVLLRRDEGPWTPILDRATLEQLALGAENDWYAQLLEHFGGDRELLPLDLQVAGGGRHVVVGASNGDMRRGLGLLLGQIQADGSVLWRHWNGDPSGNAAPYLYKDMFRRMRIQSHEGNWWFLGASSGAGSWMRRIDEPRSGE